MFHFLICEVGEEKETIRTENVVLRVSEDSLPDQTLAAPLIEMT